MSKSKRKKLKRQHPRKGRARFEPGKGRPSVLAGSTWALTLTGALVAGGALLPAPMLAQERNAPAEVSASMVRSFTIGSGPLADALTSYSQTTGIAVVDPQALAKGATSPGVSGSLTDGEALRALLTGTGLTYRFTTARSFRLERGALPEQGSGAVAVSGISVEGQLAARTVSSPKYASSLRDIPQTINVVPQQVIEAQGVTSLRDVLRNVPGLTVNAGEGGRTPGDNFNIRGFNAQNDIFVDGVRDGASYSRETFNIEAVEVTKGPGSVYMGRGSTGGSVNLVTKTAKLRPLSTASFGGGQGDFKRATIDANQPVGSLGVPGLALRLSAEWQDAGVAGLDVVKKNFWGVAPALSLGLGTPTRALLQYSRSRQDNIPTYGVQANNTNEPPQGVDTHRYFGLLALDKENVETQSAGARIERDLGAGFTLRNHTAWAKGDVDRIVTFANTNLTRRSVSHITRNENITNLTNLGGSFRTGGVQHSVALGLEYSYEKAFFGGYAFSVLPPDVSSLNNPNPNDPYTGVVTEATPRRIANANSVGVYVFETLRVSDRVQLTGGLRWDNFDPTFKNPAGGADLTPPGADSRALTWRAGFTVSPLKDGNVYVSYGTSFNPSGEGLALDATGSTAASNTLEPELNRNVEIGTKWDLLRSRLSLSIAGFRTEKTNARMTDPNDPLGQAQILAGRQRVQGIEVGASGSIVPQWTVFGGYTWLDSEFLSGNPNQVGLPLPNAPKHALSAWSTFKLPGEISLSAGARHRARSVISATASTPPYWAFDAEMSYDVSRALGFRLNLYNLTDETYYDTNRFWVPAPMRSARLTATVRH